MVSLQGISGEVTRIGCQMINGTIHKKAVEISISESPTDEHQEICNILNELDCWYNFTLKRTVEVVCLWIQHTVGLSLKFRINA